MRVPSLLIPFVLVLTTTTISCGGASQEGGSVEQPPIGASVTVQFRRDALGTAMTLPVSPTTDSQNGAQVSMHGTLERVNAEWVVIVFQGKEHWIPRSSVLLLRVNQAAEES